MTAQCIICNNSANTQRAESFQRYYSCLRCGEFKCPVGFTLLESVSASIRTALSRFIRMQMTLNNQNPSNAFFVTKETINSLFAITPSEQGKNLIRYLGVHQESAGECFEIPPGDTDPRRLEMYAEVGISISKSSSNFKFIVDGLVSQGLVDSLDASSPRRLKLSFKGWGKYEELDLRGTNSKKGFMAMKFPPNKGLKTSPPYPELKKVYEAFKSTLSVNNFTLSNPLLDGAQAGNIDARLEREIREAAFIVADLSHHNQGAYWEAGFAHGLGKKVFYTCKEDIIPHFDTNHHTTIPWTVGREKEAAEKLMDTIFNTLASAFNTLASA